MGHVQYVSGAAALSSAIRGAGNKLVVVDYFADWCGPCKMIAPTVEQLAAHHPDVHFLKVNENDSRDAMAERGIKAFPTFQFYIKNSMVHEMRGANADGLTRAVLQYKAQAGPADFAGGGTSLGGGASHHAGDMRAARLAKLGASPAPAPAPAPAAPVAPPKPSTIAAPNAADIESMLSMGFTRERACRALAAVNNAGPDAAIEWLMDHQDEPGLDDPLPSTSSVQPQQVNAGMAVASVEGTGTGEGGVITDEDKAAIATAEAGMDDAGLPKKKLTLEEVNALLAKRRAEKAEAAREDERQKEIKRREDGKKTLEMAEELQAMQRKREADKRQKERELQVKERERLLMEIAKDKAERHAAVHGRAPPELAAQIALQAAGGEAPKPVDPKAVIRAALTSLAQFKLEEAGVKAAQTIRLLCSNPLQNPSEMKYRSINLDNPKIKERVTSLEGGLALLKCAGWHKEESGEGNFMKLPPPDEVRDKLTMVIGEIDEAFKSPAQRR